MSPSASRLKLTSIIFGEGQRVGSSKDGGLEMGRGTSNHTHDRLPDGDSDEERPRLRVLPDGTTNVNGPESLLPERGVPQ